MMWISVSELWEHVSFWSPLPWFTHLGIHLIQMKNSSVLPVFLTLFVCLSPGKGGSILFQFDGGQTRRRKWILCFPPISCHHLPATHEAQHGDERSHTNTACTNEWIKWAYAVIACLSGCVCFYDTVQPEWLWEENTTDGGAAAAAGERHFLLQPELRLLCFFSPNWILDQFDNYLGTSWPF